MFLEFAAGKREYDCSPWSTVTRTPLGWKGPCYLIGKRFYDTFEEFREFAGGIPLATVLRNMKMSVESSAAQQPLNPLR